MLLQRRGKEEEETVVLYFDSWPKEERCIILPLKQVCYLSSLEDHFVVEILQENKHLQDINFAGNGGKGGETRTGVPI